MFYLHPSLLSDPQCSPYSIGGSLAINAPTYVVRQADTDLYKALRVGKFCYVLNSRQVGKSSLLVRMIHVLQKEGVKSALIDMTLIGSLNITPAQWFKGVIAGLWREFNLFDRVNLNHWFQAKIDIPPVQQLHHFIEDVLLHECFPDDELVIFIDEIDSILSLPFSVDDFFALIRSFYNQRSYKPEYNRLTFAIFGVATSADLIADNRRTPFNIGQSITLEGFQLNEAQPLVKGLERKVNQPQAVLQAILDWTRGQPFLTQKLCHLAISTRHIYTSKGSVNFQMTEAEWIDELVHQHVIHNWEDQDDPEHLRTIRDRLLRNGNRTGRILGLYQQVLEGANIKVDNSREQVELILSGLVVNRQGYLQVNNPIYQNIFDLAWVNTQFASLRPYAQAFDAWISAQQQDTSRLLRGQALKDAQTWSQGKSLSDLDYQFLAASEACDRQEVQTKLEAERAQETASRLVQEQKNVRLQRQYLTGLSIAFSVVVILAGTVIVQWQQSGREQENQIKTLSRYSSTLTASRQEFDGLIETIRIARQAQSQPNDHPIRRLVETRLRQALMDVSEYNRLVGHRKGISSVSVSPDGSTIATAGYENTVKLWRPDGTLIKTLTGHKDHVFKVNFSPDGHILASTSFDRTIKLWRPDGTLLKTLRGHREAVLDVSFSPDGQTMATSSADKTVKLWNRDGKLLKTFLTHDGSIFGLSFSPDGQILATTSKPVIKLWRLDGTLFKTLTGHQDRVFDVSFSPDGQTMATSSADKTVKLWNRDGKLLKTLTGHEGPVYRISFSPDGRTLATTSFDKTVKLWNQEGTLFQTLTGHQAFVVQASFSQDGKFLATASSDKTVRLWRLNETSQTLVGHTGEVFNASFSPDGQLLASASHDNTIKLWNRTGQFIKTLIGQSTPHNLSFSPDGQIIASVGGDKTLRLWSCRTGQLLKTLTGHRSAVVGVSFSPDGQIIATASRDKTVKLWNRRTGQLLKTLTGHRDAVLDIRFSPNGRMLATASEDNTVELWSLEGKIVKTKTLTGHDDAVFSVSFSPNGQMLATASEDRTVKLWDLNGHERYTFSGHESAVNHVRFSPDGQIIASASADNTFKLWTPDGQELYTLNYHFPIQSINFSPDGRTLATASLDKTVTLWQLDLDRLKQLSHLNFVGLLQESCHWVHDYLKTNPTLTESDRQLCEGVPQRLPKTDLSALENTNDTNRN